MSTVLDRRGLPRTVTVDSADPRKVSSAGLKDLAILSEPKRPECGPSVMAFHSLGSLTDEIQLLERMRERDPESSANMVANGKLLVEFTEQGNLRALQCALDHMQEVCER